MAIRFSGGRSRSTWREPPTTGKLDAHAWRARRKTSRGQMKFSILSSTAQTSSNFIVIIALIELWDTGKHNS